MTTTVASEALESGKGCNVTYSSGQSGTVTIPAAPSELTNGQASGWLFLYRDAAETYLIVTVLNGQASELGTIAAKQTCTEVFNYFSVVPSNVIDSSAVANDVAGYAGAFLAAHPDANASYAVIGGASVFGIVSIPAEWRVNYTTCPVNAPIGATGATFNATLNATSGTVLFEQALPSTDCSSTATIGLARAGPSPIPLENGEPSLEIARIC